ncbi:hypothetical protein NQ117_21275 [Paenibacillus sp. SC116]|nr:hypothetical protein [Paenibacillus sp. SC116]MCR8846219.1 hypothetical protein [Paenibacillus sp. SC116]
MTYKESGEGQYYQVLNYTGFFVCREMGLELFSVLQKSLRTCT